MKNLTIKKYIYLLFILAGTTLFGACSDDINDFKKDTEANASNEVYIDAANRTFKYNVYYTADDEVQGADTIMVKFPVQTTEKAVGNIRVTFTVDNALVDVYNEKNGTAYLSVSSEDLSINSVTIPEGATISTDSVKIAYKKTLIELKKIANYTKGFLIPVKIATSAGVDAKIDYSERIAYIVVDVKQGNGIFFKEEENSVRFTTIPALSEYADITDVPFTLYSESAVNGDVKINLAVNNSWVTAYNEKMGTNYLPIPEPSKITFANNAETIPDGATFANGTLSYTGVTSVLNDPNGYLIPVEIATVTGDDITGEKARKVFYVIVDISNLYSIQVADDSELGVKQSDRTGYSVPVFVNAATGANVAPANGATAYNNMFNATTSSFWMTQTANLKLKVVVDLGSEVSDITGLLLESAQPSASMTIRDVDLSYATQAMYDKGQETSLWKLRIPYQTAAPTSPPQFLYIKFSQPVTGRYIILNNMCSNSQIMGLRGFFIYTNN